MIYVYACDDMGCGSYRSIWPFQAARAVGLEDAQLVMPGGDPQIGGDVDMDTYEVKDIVPPPDAEVIVLQRPMMATVARMVPLLRAKGIAVVVELDDDLQALSSRHVVRQDFDRIGGHLYGGRWLVEACRDATLVTCTTPALARKYGAHGRVRVIPNTIPDHLLDVEALHPWEPAIGWPGMLISHPDDLRQVGNALARLPDIPVRIVGNNDPVTVRRMLGRDAAVIQEDVPFGEWMPTIASLHIGLAPLDDTPFNRAKSWLKPLELAAVGRPCVTSPLPEYERLGLGLSADKPRVWRGLLRRLWDDEVFYKEHAERARVAAGTWVTSAVAHLWAEAWCDARDMERRGYAPAASG